MLLSAWQKPRQMALQRHCSGECQCLCLPQIPWTHSYCFLGGEKLSLWCVFLPGTYWVSFSILKKIFLILWCFGGVFWVSFFKELPSKAPPLPYVFHSSQSQLEQRCSITNLNFRVPYRIILRSFSVGLCLRSPPLLGFLLFSVLFSPTPTPTPLPGTLP